MNELEEIRKRKLEEMQEKQQEQLNQQAQIQDQLNQMEVIVKSKMTKEAIQRYSNIKVAYPDKAVQVLVLLGGALQSGQITTIDDDMLKNILKRITPEKKDIKIIRK